MSFNATNGYKISVKYLVSTRLQKKREVSTFKNSLVLHEAVPQRFELLCRCPPSYPAHCCLAHLVCSWLTLFVCADLVYLITCTGDDREHCGRRRKTLCIQFWPPGQLFPWNLPWNYGPPLGQKFFRQGLCCGFIP